jgi:4-amino-4-deoxy-L-arabinose transferase-like glycosyltransferase
MPRAAPAAIAVGALLCAWALIGLFGRDPWKPDEAYTVGVVYEMVQTGNWTVPAIAGEPFLEKPPLFYASAAFFAWALRDRLPLHEAARIATVFYVAIALLFLALTARALYGPGAAVPAVLLVAGSAGLLSPAHLLLTDNALLAGFAVALFGLAIAPARPAAGGILTGLGAGCAFLAKGLLGPGVVVLTALALRFVPAGEGRAYRRSFAWAAAAAAPWLIVWPAMLHGQSPALFDEWFWKNNIGRFTGEAQLGPELDHWMYLRILPAFAMPLLPIAAWSLWRAARESGRRLLQWRFAVPLASASVLLLVLSASSSSRNVYLLPVLLPLGLLCVATPQSLASPLARWLGQLGAAGAAALTLAAVALWGALLAGWPEGIAERLLARNPGYVPSASAWAVAAALAFALSWLALLRIPWRGLRMPLTWTGSLTMAWAIAVVLWLPYVDHGKSYRGVMAQMSSHVPSGECVATRGLRETHLAMVAYFGHVRSLPQESPAGAACRWLLLERSGSVPAPGATWSLAWSGARPGDHGERLWLFRKKPAVPFLHGPGNPGDPR